MCQMMATRGYLIEDTHATQKFIADLFESALGLHLEQFGICSALRCVEDTFAPLMEALVTFENEYVLFINHGNVKLEIQSFSQSDESYDALIAFHNECALIFRPMPYR